MSRPVLTDDRIRWAIANYRGPYYAAPASVLEDRADFAGPPKNPLWIVCNSDGYNILGAMWSMRDALFMSDWMTRGFA